MPKISFGDFSSLPNEEQLHIQHLLANPSPFLQLPWNISRSKETLLTCKSIQASIPIQQVEESSTTKSIAPPAPSSATSTSKSTAPAWGQSRQWSTVFSKPKAPSTSPVEFAPTKPVDASYVDPNLRAFGEQLQSVTELNWQPRRLQPRGLQNRANWCYINSTVQALLGCPAFVNLLKSLPVEPLPRRGPSAIPITDHLVRLINEFSFLPEARAPMPGAQKVKPELVPGTPFEPHYMYRMLHDLEAKQFALGRQEDAEEFLSSLLNALHEEMIGAVKHVTSPELLTTNGVSESQSDEETETNDWQQVGPRNKALFCRKTESGHSPVSQIFGGLLRYALFKPGTKESADIQTFFTLPLDIQSPGIETLQDALLRLVTPETLEDYKCSQSNSVVEASRRISLERLPPVLIIQLKRFVYSADKGGTLKLTKPVRYPVNLEITKDLLSASARAHCSVAERRYRLTGVQYHTGARANGGHYTTDVLLQAERPKSPNAGKPVPTGGVWMRFDDCTCRVLSQQQVLAGQAETSGPRATVPYLLYYTHESKLHSR